MGILLDYCRRYVKCTALMSVWVCVYFALRLVLFLPSLSLLSFWWVREWVWSNFRSGLAFFQTLDHHVLQVKVIVIIIKLYEGSCLWNSEFYFLWCFLCRCISHNDINKFGFFFEKNTISNEFFVLKLKPHNCVTHWLNLWLKQNQNQNQTQLQQQHQNLIKIFDGIYSLSFSVRSKCYKWICNGNNV